MIPKTTFAAGVGLAIVAAWRSHARAKTISEDKPAVARVVKKTQVLRRHTKPPPLHRWKCAISLFAANVHAYVLRS